MEAVNSNSRARVKSLAEPLIGLSVGSLVKSSIGSSVGSSAGSSVGYFEGVGL